MRLAILFFLVSVGAWAQTCTVTSPSSAQLIQTLGAIQLTATPSSVPDAYRGVWSIDGLRYTTTFIQDQHQAIFSYRNPWAGPFVATWYTGLQGDGPHVAALTLYDIKGTSLASCSQSFTVRLAGISNGCINELPNNGSSTPTTCPGSPLTTASGIGALGIIPYDRTNSALGSGAGASSYMIDGYPISASDQYCGGDTASSQQTGGLVYGSQIGVFNTNCFPNGSHLVFIDQNTGTFTGSFGGLGAPYVLSSSFTNSNVSGTTLNLVNHYAVQNAVGATTLANVGVFQTSGTLPTPLTQGVQCYTHTGYGNCTVTYTVSGRTIIFTSTMPTTATGFIAPTVTTSTPMFVRNLGYTNQSNGQNSCDGAYTPSAVTESSTGGVTTIVATITLAVGCSSNGTVTAVAPGNPVKLILSGNNGRLPASGDAVSFLGFTSSNDSQLNLSNGQYFATLLKVEGGNTAQYSLSTQNGPFSCTLCETTGFGSPTFTGILASSYGLEVIFNPWYPNYIDQNDIGVSLTPGGSSVSLNTSASTGTFNFWQRIRSLFWAASTQSGTDDNIFAYSAGPYVQQPVTFSNNNNPMELEPPFWEVHMVVGGSTVSVCPTIKNTDLSPTTITCSTATYTPVNDGNTLASNVLTVTNAGVITAVGAGWAQVKVGCPSPGCISNLAQPNGLAPVTVYVQVHSGSVTNPTFTTCGPISNSFQTGSCYSFIPMSQYYLNVDAAVSGNYNWFGPMFQGSTQNAATSGIQNSSLNSSTATSCTNWNGTLGQSGILTPDENFAAKWNLHFEDEQFWDIYFGQNGNITPLPLAMILGNTGYNRQACVQAYVQHQVLTGLYWAYYNDDEISDYFGNILQSNPNIQAVSTTEAAYWSGLSTSGGVTTFNIANVWGGGVVSSPLPNGTPNWDQPSGNGSAIQLTGISSVPACNGWYLVSSYGSTTITAPSLAGCPDGTNISVTTDPIAQLNPPVVEEAKENNATPCIPGSSALQNCGPLPWNTAAGYQPLGSTYTITMSGSTATVNIPNSGLTVGQAIRVHNGTTTNLNIIAPVTSVSPSGFTYVYPGTTGGLAPTCPSNVCNGTTDPRASITVDPNWGPNPIGQYYSIISSVAGHPARRWSMLGSIFFTPSSVISYQGTASNSDAAFIFIGTSLSPNYVTDASAWQWMTYSAQDPSGLATRGLQLQPRASLYAENENWVAYCRSSIFNYGCDKPSQLTFRPEGMAAQLMGMAATNVSAFRGYNFQQSGTTTPGIYGNTCCGFSGIGTGFGNGSGGINQFIMPEVWNSLGVTSALLAQNTRWMLQPFANKPYFGPMFVTDAHTNATYGNYLSLTCGSESPYGMFTVTLPQISGGVMVKKTIDGYVETVSIMSGNPTTDTDEYCSSAGKTTIYLAEAAGQDVIDYQVYLPPVTLPFGATKYLIKIGYTPYDFGDVTATDCTSGCTIPVDHHNNPAWFQTIYANNNFVPVGPVATPTIIASQGLP